MSSVTILISPLRVKTVNNASTIFTCSLIGFGQLFNGLGMSVTGAIPPAVSEVWFPLKERATATAIAALAGGLGGASTFIIGKYSTQKGTVTVKANIIWLEQWNKRLSFLIVF